MKGLHFKPYLSKTPSYVGGKSLHEIETNASKIYKLSSNENALGTSPKAKEAIMSAVNNLYQYPDRTDGRLREKLSFFYHGELDAEHFMATPSGSEMIDLIVRGFMGPDATCIVSNPSFKPYTMFSENMGSQVVDVPLQLPNYSLDVQGILDAIDDRTRIIFLTSPNNPTGNHIPKNHIDQLVHHMPDHILIVLDEVYHHYVDSDDYTTAMPYVREGHQMIGLNSFSKAYGLAGLRIGYGYGPKKVMSYLRALWKPFLLNALATEAAMAALEDHEFIQETRSLVISERRRLSEVFDSMGINYIPSQANFFLIDPKMNDEIFEARMLEHGIMVRPCSGFSAPDRVRVTIGTQEANDAFLRALKEVIK